MAWPYKIAVDSGSPWCDYKEAAKTLFSLSFPFKISDNFDFILKTVTVAYQSNLYILRQKPANFAHLPIKVKIDFSSTQNEFSPSSIPSCLISSPSETFNDQGLTAEQEAQGMRLIPFVFNRPCYRGENIRVAVEGDDINFTVRCLISGRIYGVGAQS
jgi:hypothetical protein